MEDIQGIYDRDIALNELDRPWHSIIKETLIGLTTLEGTLDLKAIFDRYRLDWMV